MTSPSTLTLGRAKTSSLINISGVCIASDQGVDQLNEATKRLMDYGDWYATIVKARVCIDRGCVTWPRWVGTVLATNLCGHNRQIANHWYDFVPLSANDCSHYGRWGSNTAFTDDGATPVFSNVPCGFARYLQVYARYRTDFGKTITFYGIDDNGQEVMVKDALGDWVQGETIVLATPYARSTKKFREVTKVIKDLTVGPVDVYQYDGDTTLLSDMAHYEPSETNPMYRHATLHGCTSGCVCSSGSTSTTSKTLEILAKLQFIPVAVDADTIQIDNIPALKLMIQAVRLEEAGDDDGANKKQAMAIKELNRQLRNKFPLDQISVVMAGEGTALPVNHRIGLVH